MNHALKRLSQPMAIEPQTLRVMAAIASRGRLEAAALAQAKAEWDARRESQATAEEQGGAVEGTGGTLRIIDNVGVLSIEGPLFRHADMFTDISGGTSYNAIWRGLEAALSSPAVRSILLRINSPGGEVDGLNELAEGIAAASDNKPVWAFADNCCASAAYWLASQAVRVVAEPTAEIGSIGVRCGLLDDSKADEMAGLREIEIVSSTSPGKRSRPVDDEVIARVQSRIDDLATLFVEAVARGRGVDPATVLADFGQGDVMIASKAVGAGLADELGDFNSTLAALAGAAVTGTAFARAPRTTPGATMPTTEPTATAPRADEDKSPPQLRCAKCQGECGATVYCPGCYDDHDEPDGDEDEAALVVFGSKALALLGTDLAHADEALVAVKRGSDALAQAKAAEEAAKAAAAAAAKKSCVDAIKAALDSGPLALGDVSSLLPFLSDDDAAAALGVKLADAVGDYEATAAALAGYDFTAADARRIGAYLGNKPSPIPATRRLPADTESNHAEVAKVAAAAKGHGARVYSIADIAAAAKKENVR